jgi:CheY-like chemotaxis protein
MMSGDISVTSTVGTGSTFTIHLPLVVPDAAAQDMLAKDDAAPASPPTVLSEANDEPIVLVIDDDPEALELLGRTLERAGVTVVKASEGREALKLARNLHPAAITLDVLMPGMDGWEVLGELKADPETRDIPVIMVTMTNDRNLGYTLGATDFLTKPVRRDQLIELLARYATGSDDRHALVVDDKAENRDVLRRALEKEGWRVTEAENGRLALDEVSSDPPSLVLLDLLMPVMDGFEFVHEMHQRKGPIEIPIVVVTAKDITHEDRQRLQGGVIGMIERGGLDQDSLVETLRSQLKTADAISGLGPDPL